MEELLDDLEKLIAALGVARTPGRDMAALRRLLVEAGQHPRSTSCSLTGELTDVIIDFIDFIKTPDEDVIEILQAYLAALRAVADGNTRTGDDGTAKILKQELRDACRRYLAKKAGGKSTA